MVVFEAGPPVGCPQQSLESAGQVDEAVAHEEEHGDNGGDLVQVTDQDTDFRDNCRENEARSEFKAVLKLSCLVKKVKYG